MIATKVESVVIKQYGTSLAPLVLLRPACLSSISCSWISCSAAESPDALSAIRMDTAKRAR